MKKLLMAVILVVTLGSSVFLTGCLNEPLIGTQSSTNSEKQINTLNGYVQAVNWFNDSELTFSFAIDPNLADMKEGRPIESVSLPAYGKLQADLKKAVADGDTSFEDINSSAKEVLVVLDEMVPLTTKMENYYESKQYTTDNHEQGAIFIKQYLALYEKFKVAYDKLDSATQQATHEIAVEKIKVAKNAGRMQEATFREMYIVGGEIIKLLDAEPIDANAINAKVEELQKLNEALNPKGDKVNAEEVQQFKERINRFIGATRDYVANTDKDVKPVVDTYNDMIDKLNDVDPTKLDK